MPLVAALFIGSVTAAPAAVGDHVVPAQFVAKLYTEGLGRAPDQAGWAADVAAFDSMGCTLGSLERVGKHRLESAELINAWGGDPEALAEIAVRALLNREPDPAGFRALVADVTRHGWDAALTHLFAGGEFRGLVSQICSTASPSYGFNDSTGAANGHGPVAACTSCLAVPPAVGAIDPTEDQLRALASVPGSIIVLAPRAVIPLSQPLQVARGVTIETAGLPAANRYIDMARLVRNFGASGPRSPSATVILQGGATLQSVWVSGQRALWRNTVEDSGGSGGTQWNSWGQIQGGSDVQLLGGVGTTVLDDRVDDAPGTSSIEMLGFHDGYLCADNVVQGNLIEAYSSVHLAAPARDDEVPWTDGISVHCQSARVTLNQIIDATDVPVIVFQSHGDGVVNPPQTSQVSSNVIVSAGNSAYSALAIDPGWNPSGRGDPPGGAGSRDFTGAVIGGTAPVPAGGPTAPGQGNLMWTGPRTHFNVVVSDGTTDFYGPMAYDGHGAQVLDNTTGSGSANAAAGLVVSGMMKTTVQGNSLAVTFVRTGPNEIWRCSGAEHAVEWFYPQRASGEVQGNPAAVEIPPAHEPSCIVAGT